MRRIHCSILVAAVAALPAIAGAQRVFRDFGYDFRDGAHDFLSVWWAPFHGSPRDYATAGLVLGGVGLSAFADRSVGDWFRDHPSSKLNYAVAAFRDNYRVPLVKAGSGAWLGKGALVIYVGGLVSGKQGLRDAGMGCIAAEQSQAIPRGLLPYRFVSRERPLFLEIVDGDTITRRAGDPYRIKFPGTDSWYDNSFFGGHVANWTTCVTFWNTRFHLGVLEPVLWGTVAMMGVGRLADQRHWLSDELLGIAVGYATGRYVAQRSLARRDRRNAADSVRSDSTRADTSRVGGFRGLVNSARTGLYMTRQDGMTYVGWRRN